LHAFSTSDPNSGKPPQAPISRNRIAHRPCLVARTLFAPGLLLFLSLAANSAHGQSNSAEYQLKAAFIFHFAQLVDWPADALGPDSRPITLCTTGENSLAGIMESTIDGKQIGSHSLQVRHLQEKENPRGCHLLVIVGRDKRRVAAILAGLNGAPILTVGESEDFVQRGGMIGFCLQENKIRFDINLNAAQRANLKINSRLLLLAKTVIGDGRRG